jgi:hypothetical protein
MHFYFLANDCPPFISGSEGGCLRDAESKCKQGARKIFSLLPLQLKNAAFLGRVFGFVTANLKKSSLVISPDTAMVQLAWNPPPPRQPISAVRLDCFPPSRST